MQTREGIYKNIDFNIVGKNDYPTKRISTSQEIIERYGIVGNPGTKTTCPFCGHKTFSIKRDDTIGKCFHPSCGRYIIAGKHKEDDYSGLNQVLESFYHTCHRHLINLQNAPADNAYQYLIGERQIHSQVVANSMLGAIPEGLDLENIFSPILEKSKSDSHRIKKLKDIKAKLEKCIAGHAGWLCFFYTDAFHRIISIKFRKPYFKQFAYFKPFKSAGVFGHGLFSLTGSNLADDIPLIVTEGEFNQLQLQSLSARRSESLGNEAEYLSACSIGGIHNADFDTIQRINKHPIICYDHDISGAGFELVKKAQEVMGVQAVTTPEPDSDLDEYICSFDNDITAAWDALKDLIAKRQTYPREYASVKKEVYCIRQKHGSKDIRRDFEINHEVAKTVRADLSDRGRFYWNDQGSYFFDEMDHRLIALDRDNQDCALLLSKYGVNRTEGLYRYLVEDLWINARTIGNRAPVHRHTFYDKENSAVHIYNHDNRIYRIDQKSIDLVNNGSEGVLFLSDSMAEPFIIGRPDYRTSPLDKFILSQVNFAEDCLSPDERRLLLTIWIYSLFFESIMPSKPILAFVGEKGSGKSVTLQKIGMLLFGGGFNVIPLPNKVEDFDTAVTNSSFVAIDNADSRSKWLEDRLAIVATGGTIEKRMLYTTNTVAKHPVHCFLSITSRTPHFKRDDVADRLLIMKVSRYNSFKAPEKVLSEVIDHRNDIMTEIAYQIQEILHALQSDNHDCDADSFRMADFGEFALRIAHYCGMADQVRQILKKTTTEQSAFTLEGDPIYEYLEEWVNNNQGKEVTSAELCGELTRMAEKKNTKFPYADNGRGFAQKFAHLKPNLSEFFEITERTAGGRKKVYAFWHKQKASEMGE